jgi:hypothetical protein
MPGHGSFGGRRARGSWTPRIIGIAAVIVLAAGAVIASLASAGSGATRHVAGLPSAVRSVETAGLVSPGPGTPAPPQMLVPAAAGLAFSPVPASQLTAGNPQWTVDQMTGGTYIFIYAPTGQCLASLRASGSPRVALRRCDLSGLTQRWRRVNPAVQQDGRYYGQYASLSSGRCITAAATAATAPPGSRPATLTPCDRAQPWRQLLSFWWAA